MFKIEIRTTCKVCDSLIKNKRSRTYCSVQCRNRFYNQKYCDMHTDWQRARRDREAMKPSPKKVQCLVCGKWYVQVCTHIYQVHGMTGREYREAYDLEVKRGVVPKWYRQKKGDTAIKNGTFQNLKKGKAFWYEKGSKVAGRYRRSPVTMARLRIQGKTISMAQKLKKRK